MGIAIYSSDIDELKCNGEIKFNGLFKGSIVYRNYHFKQEKVRRNGQFVYDSVEGFSFRPPFYAANISFVGKCEERCRKRNLR